MGLMKCEIDLKNYKDKLLDNNEREMSHFYIRQTSQSVILCSSATFSFLSFFLNFILFLNFTILY